MANSETSYKHQACTVQSTNFINPQALSIIIASCATALGLGNFVDYGKW